MNVEFTIDKKTDDTIFRALLHCELKESMLLQWLWHLSVNESFKVTVEFTETQYEVAKVHECDVRSSGRISLFIVDETRAVTEPSVQYALWFTREKLVGLFNVQLSKTPVVMSFAQGYWGSPWTRWASNVNGVWRPSLNCEEDSYSYIVAMSTVQAVVKCLDEYQK